MKYPEISQLYEVFTRHPEISTDTRKIRPGSLFFALKGESFDANKFAADAIQSGARYAVIDDPRVYAGEQYILVKNVLASLQELAAFHRTRLSIPIIGITGSNGKTTTKELIREVLARKFKVLATEGNLNNHIGVPLTLLSIRKEVEIAIIEMGANHMGEIAELCAIARPDFGIITNIGKAHIGEFGSFENIVRTKGELYVHLRNSGGLAFVNIANEMLMKMSDGIRRVTYGPGSGADFPVVLRSSMPYVSVSAAGVEMITKMIGHYNFENVAAALCIGAHFGITTGAMADAVAGYVPGNNRSQIVEREGYTLILDAYNANPTSMAAAIDNFSGTEYKNKVAILGDMLELGKYAQDEHSKILAQASAKGFNRLVLVGPLFAEAWAASGNPAGIEVYPTTEALIAAIQKERGIPQGSGILLKGSRGIRLEKVAEVL